MQGRVTRVISGFYDIIDLKTKEKYSLLRGSGSLRNQNNSPLVGDIVEYDPKGFVTQIYPRKNFFTRPKVANIDQALVIISIKEPNFSTLLLDKFLILIENSQITPIIIVTKIDLDVSNYPNLLKDYENMGYTIFYINNLEKKVSQELLNTISNKINFVVGQTGVGKTSFINSVLGENYQVQEISKSLNRGKHTTRVVQIITKNNISIIDTPGFSSFELNLDKLDLPYAFEIFSSSIGKCKFFSCQHIQENDKICDIKNRVNKGLIPASRYQNYVHFWRKSNEKNN
ncbi:Putative ribosome biogenesis GTPase rsgA [Mesomycoplasma conjunctivae]|uniref:Small ribosomal subunit biogenesis GTPase RsgA n=1 Tax=Mesomycoplasma conjunctivae (strain ATCC 25834 / NCTC 10147 / HRC/581) TaxID=572263 RepID=C5J762_MESCH|nr:ribosome small subunit-dependent GTPase A [Mesomycoplasma conjunctivae]CAT05325.1 Putative ribosome biogenesis GTPase rsgA [Mesomycoplasma conjunctivae]VEU66551.1 Putative ribosome biogenesis GTPase rsgA [Mesomycoplasma conjunctivae]